MLHTFLLLYGQWGELQQAKILNYLHHKGSSLLCHTRPLRKLVHLLCRYHELMEA